MIRPATARDLDGVAPLAGSPQRAESRLRAAAVGDDSMFVAVLDGRTAGVVSIRWAGDCDPPHPWLYGLHVTADLQRRGIGRALVTTCEGVARDRGATHLSLDVDVDDARANAFYEALGYAVVRAHDHRWRAVDGRTGKTTAEGTTPTLILRRALR